jgi:hypothetical protein
MKGFRVAAIPYPALLSHTIIFVSKENRLIGFVVIEEGIWMNN